ncbi:hypothetical protein DFH08DRAFT_665005, partial [Mycena albidolilacea]
MHRGTRLRRLFIMLLLFSDPSDPKKLWEDFCEDICDDLDHHPRRMAFENPSESDVYDYGLF